MSVIRLGMHRAGVIDKMVPQAVEEWLSDKMASDPPGGEVGRQVADQALHLAYGVIWAALAAPVLAGQDGQRSLLRGESLD
jgi:hypothetical protein